MMGILLDAKNKVVLVLVSEESVGVALDRYETIPSTYTVPLLVNETRWVVLHRRNTDINFQERYEGEIDVVLRSPEGRESTQFAVELALHMWPEWGEALRSAYTPRWTMMPLLQEEAVA